MSWGPSRTGAIAHWWTRRILRVSSISRPGDGCPCNPDLLRRRAPKARTGQNSPISRRYSASSNCLVSSWNRKGRRWISSSSSTWRGRRRISVSIQQIGAEFRGSAAFHQGGPFVESLLPHFPERAASREKLHYRVAFALNQQV